MSEYAPVNLSAPDQVEFELNGRQLKAPVGTMLVDAAYAHGVEVPIFCYEARLGAPIGACRMCLVHVEGMRGLQTACSTAVQPDMVVRTDTDEVRDAHDGVLEMLLANHPLDCPVCDKGGECPLQDRTFRFGPGTTQFLEHKRHFPKPLDLSSLIALDRERCISCFRCVRFSQDVAEDGHLVMLERGAASEIATFTGDAYTGRFTGNVIDLCPVGALTSVPYRFVARPWDIKNAPSVCGHCPVGCNVELTEREGHVARVTGRPLPNYAVEEGWLCDKARFAYPEDRAADRLREPVIRDAGTTRPASIEEAVKAAGLLLGRNGPHAFLLGPGATVEEGFLAQELASGPCRGALVAHLGLADPAALSGLRAAAAAQLDDLDRADVVALVGGDPANQQPVVELRVRKAARRGALVASTGPRRHALSDLGRSSITQPGSLLEGVQALGSLLEGAERPVVLWDELDLAHEPAAAGALAELIGATRRARQLELGADVNGAGLRALGIQGPEELVAALEGGSVGTLVTIHAEPGEAAGAARWTTALPGADAVVAIAAHGGGIAEHAAVVLPAATHREQEGVYVSMAGRAQRLRPGATAPAGAAPGWELLIALAHQLGAPPPHRTAAAAFAAAAAARPGLAGLGYDTIGDLGALVPTVEASSSNGSPSDGWGDGPGLPLIATQRIFGDRTAHRSDALSAVRQGAEAVLGAGDAARLELEGASRVRLQSSHGACTLPLRVDAECPDGAVQVTLGVPEAGVELLLPVDRSPVRVEVTAA